MATDPMRGIERGQAGLDKLAERIEANFLGNASESSETAESPQPLAVAAFSISESVSKSSRNRDADKPFDTLATPPMATNAMFYGVLGRLAQRAADGTEVNPVAAMAAAMSWLSASIGRNTCIPVGDQWHNLRLYTLNIGRSSRGGKGMALDLLKRVTKRIGEAHDGLRPQMHTGGLSSREGLAFLIHDGYREGREEVPPITDKRLFIVETEFANVLAQGKREGNTLSSVLRDAWDGVSIKPATRSSRIWATRPHIALHGCITPTELRGRMASNDLSNGFANRFMMVWAERIGVVPFPSRASDEVVSGFAHELAAVIRFGLAGYPDRDQPQLLSFQPAAADLFSNQYREYAKPHPSGELITGLLQRRAPMLLRMAGLFAVADRLMQIKRDHVAAAAAWMDYYAQSVAFVFSPTVDVDGEAHRNDNAEKLARFLNGRDWVSRTEIANACFKKAITKKDFDAAIEHLAIEHRIERRTVEVCSRVKRTDYRVTAPTIPANPQETSGLQDTEMSIIPTIPSNPGAGHNEVEL